MQQTNQPSPFGFQVVLLDAKNDNREQKDIEIEEKEKAHLAKLHTEIMRLGLGLRAKLHAEIMRIGLGLRAKLQAEIMRIGLGLRA